jgi:XRE family transcriptional regulator, regulator of sulfur utilization
MDEFGQRLERMRRRRVLTQQALAEKSGVSLIQIARLENDVVVNPRANTVRALAKALDIDPAWLLFGDTIDENEGKAAA